MYSVDTPIRGEGRGNPAAILAWAKAKGAQRLDDLEQYLETVYRLAPALGINPDVVVGQSHLETDGWRSLWYVARMNVAGIGITGDIRQNSVSRDFLNGEAAARAHLLHLSLYVNGIAVPSGFLETDDPRWDAAVEAGYAGIADTLADLNNRWAIDPQDNYHGKIAGRMNEMVAAGLLPADVEAPMAVTFHKVPKPGMVDMTYIARNKIEGVGWDNLGQRKPKFIALHRMYGTLRGTDSYFAPPNSPHLTDYAIGVEEIDGKNLAGEIHQYNDPLGFRSGWASGRVSAPYGDGKAIVDKYGINAVNRDGVSIELSGYWTTPVDDFAWGEYVKLIAYWVDAMEIPHSSLPKNPHTGINAFVWHQEFTIGTGKVCPGKWLMDNTQRLYKDVAAYLQPFQTGAGTGETPKPEPEPEPVPVPTYAKPLPIAELAAISDVDTNAQQAIVTREADDFIFVGDVVETIRPTKRRQSAAANSPSTGPDLAVGERFAVDYLIKASDGQWYYVTPYWTRILAKDTKRVSDVQVDAA